MMRGVFRGGREAIETATRWRIVRGRGLFAFLVFLLLIPGFTAAQSHDERSVKAAFVFNLTKYVEWPQPNSEMVIGYLGEEGTGEIFKKMLDGKRSGSQSIRVLLLPSTADLQRCQILYVAESSENKVRVALEQVRGKSVLTVGDTDSFIREGGMVGLITMGEQIQIKISLEVAQESRLKISSRLLSIATLVKPVAEARN